MQCTTPKAAEKKESYAKNRAIKAELRPGKDQPNHGTTMETSKQHLCDMHRARRRRRVLVTAALVSVLAGLSALAVYAVYRPMKPQASVARAAVYQLANAGAGNGDNSTAFASSPPYALAVRVQFTLLLHNPNDRGALPVTPPALLPALVQERGADVALSPLLGGGVAVPVSADAAGALAADCAARRVRLRLVVMGRVRYKVGPFRSGWRDLYVRCGVALGLGRDAVPADGSGISAPLLEYPTCFVDA